MVDVVPCAEAEQTPAGSTLASVTDDTNDVSHHLLLSLDALTHNSVAYIPTSHACSVRNPSNRSAVNKSSRDDVLETQVRYS